MVGSNQSKYSKIVKNWATRNQATMKIVEGSTTIQLALN
nr:MAG TPA: hypothetical protein [Caudoviricetes sp.]DAG85745.1 MAG TPA: hypothetical protein [Caudoviricetes sp.]DAJ33063.1 MAG TPA: hypothetical protein [Caudoviricetes sp.]